MEFSELPSDAERIIQCVDDLKKKLLSVEAQRISRIWENCISQIEIVATLPTDLHTVSSDMDKELIKNLKKHQLACERLERGTQEGLEQESGGEATKARPHLDKDIQSSVRDVLRFLRSHPDAIFGLRAILSMEAGESENKLIRELKGFHSHMLNKLLTSPFEESQSTLQNMAITPLQQVLHDLEHTSSQEAEVAKTIQQIHIKIIQKTAEVENLRQQFSMLSITDEKYQRPHRASEEKASMQEKIDHLKIQLNILKQENTAALVILHKEDEKVEKILDLRQTFDNDVEEKEVTLQQEKIRCKKVVVEELGMQGTLQQQLVSQLKEKKDQLQSTSLEKRARIQQRIDQLKIQVDDLTKENTKGEFALQRKNDEEEKIKTNLRQTFDKEHEIKQDKLEMEELDNEEELNKLRKLENAFSVIEGEYNQIEERLAEEQRRKELLVIQIKAVIIAQAWWRGYKTRKALREKVESEALAEVKGKKKKGGKKGGKKGKSKKKK
ncbi:uncharacterized protein LOC131468874 [Solea solea]|uniref:uncharacterized protein LOC131468874 n=1 Tax=Solea solea TaxID=90069 RepID=UPI00272CBABB|nr:uncharacterized protein LOC131468874 [Solea solea]